MSACVAFLVDVLCSWTESGFIAFIISASSPNEMYSASAIRIPIRPKKRMIPASIDSELPDSCGSLSEPSFSFFAIRLCRERLGEKFSDGIQDVLKVAQLDGFDEVFEGDRRN